MLLTPAIPTLTMLMANATYDFPAVRTTLTEVFTNKVPTDAYRGAGRPEATYFIERGLDMLARELKMDPAELRRKNFIQPDQFPVPDADGRRVRLRRLREALDLALKNSNWEQLKAERDAAQAQGRLVGLGLSMYVEVCGIGPSATLPTGGWEHAQVTIERDGHVTAMTGVSPHGQGNETTFAQMLADQFGIPLEHVTVLHGDTGIVKQGIGTFGSRSQAVGGSGDAHGRHEGQSQDGEVRRRPSRSARGRHRVRERHDRRERVRRPRRSRSARWRRSRTSRCRCLQAWSLD
jgi:carbon-monoxide dehydrogenase large subunit